MVVEDIVNNVSLNMTNLRQRGDTYHVNFNLGEDTFKNNFGIVNGMDTADIDHRLKVATLVELGNSRIESVATNQEFLAVGAGDMMWAFSMPRLEGDASDAEALGSTRVKTHDEEIAEAKQSVEDQVAKCMLSLMSPARHGTDKNGLRRGSWEQFQWNVNVLRLQTNDELRSRLYVDSAKLNDQILTHEPVTVHRSEVHETEYLKGVACTIPPSSIDAEFSPLLEALYHGELAEIAAAHEVVLTVKAFVVHEPKIAEVVSRDGCAAMQGRSGMGVSPSVHDTSNWDNGRAVMAIVIGYYPLELAQLIVEILRALRKKLDEEGASIHMSLDEVTDDDRVAHGWTRDFPEDNIMLQARRTSKEDRDEFYQDVPNTCVTVLCEYAVSVALTLMKGRTTHLRSNEKWASAIVEVLYPGIQKLYPYGDTPVIDFNGMPLLPIRTDMIAVTYYPGVSRPTMQYSNGIFAKDEGLEMSRVRIDTVQKELQSQDDGRNKNHPLIVTTFADTESIESTVAFFCMQEMAVEMMGMTPIGVRAMKESRPNNQDSHKLLLTGLMAHMRVEMPSLTLERIAIINDYGAQSMQYSWFTASENIIARRHRRKPGVVQCSIGDCGLSGFFVNNLEDIDADTQPACSSCAGTGV